MKRIKIMAGDVVLTAELFDTDTARQIRAALPLEGDVNTWGDEIYFYIPSKIAEAPDARCEVENGELGYWPEGGAFCIFFGPTPVSTDDKPRAYSPVNVFGRLLEDPTPLRDVAAGAGIRVTAAGR